MKLKNQGGENEGSQTKCTDMNEKEHKIQNGTSNTQCRNTAGQRGSVENKGTSTECPGDSKNKCDNTDKINARSIHFIKALCRKAGFELLKDMDFLSLIFLSFNINFILTAVIGYFPALAVEKGINPLDAG